MAKKTYYHRIMPSALPSGDIGIKMKILGAAAPGNTLFGDDRDDEEHEQLILIRKNGYQGFWFYLPRVTLILLLLASVVSISVLIGKEYYLLSNQKSYVNQLYASDEPLVNGITPVPSKCVLETYRKFDCHTDPNATEHNCLDRGCCWVPADLTTGIPSCFYAKGQYFYRWSDPKETEFGLESSGLIIKRTLYPDNIKLLTMRVYFESEDIVRVKIFDAHRPRFEVPLEYNSPIVKATNQNYIVNISMHGFTIFRKGMSFPLFDSTVAPLVFANEFLEVSSSLPSEFIYGLGEAQDTLARNMNWTRSLLWAHDKIPGDKNLYGAHPFYLCMETNGKSHGVFLANSNAMEVILQPNPTPAVTFRTIGGLIDLRIFVGTKPSDVMKQYTSVIGLPMLPPYWSLGFHLCRFNYPNVTNTKYILDKNVEAGIPIDVQWNDLDYMKDQKDFTYDAEKFGDLPGFVAELHRGGRHYVPLIDAGISGGEPPGSYSAYDEGLAQDIFIKDYKDEVFVGKVWNPTSTVWPDFSHPNSTHYWTMQFSNFHDKVAFDGAWLDMNEPSNFWNGAKDGCPKNSTLDHPPYAPRVDGNVLYYKTICLSAKQFKGRHYDLHNLHGTLETIATAKALGDVRQERAFVISRSTFPGQGKYGGHWTGDVVSSWDHMRASVPQILTFGLFGIPMVGADICGFNGNTTKSLCKRWMQLGAFYPFSRNHNTDDGIPQDPWSLGKKVVDASRETLKVRYSLLPYIYTQFFHAHLTGEPVARPLFYEFPNDDNTYRIETQFMLGPSVLIIPVLDDNEESTIRAYLPKGWWYQHYFDEIIESLSEMRDIQVPVQNHSIPVLYRSGSIIIRQNPGLTTTESRNNKASIHIYLDENGEAKGSLFWDDGVTASQHTVGTYNQFSMYVKKGFFRMDVDHHGYESANVTIGHIEVRGIMSAVNSVVVGSTPWDSFKMNEKTRTLELDNLALDINDGLQMQWSA